MQHEHSFGQDRKRPGEAKTVIVIVITGTMMVVEVLAGIVFGSMALLADGLHMASHAAALSVSAFAYIYARRHAHDERFSFGTGKVNSLGGFTGAVLLAIFALMMGFESTVRMIHPVKIAFDQAIAVAIVGLLVNGASLFILWHEENDPHANHHHDHNLRAAYLHVLADTLTSLLAIFALLAGKYYDLVRMDPLMGIFGAILVSHWSLGLLLTTSSTLLDKQGPQHIQEAIRTGIEQHAGNRVADLHLWAIGPSLYAVEISVLTNDPQQPEHYKQMMPAGVGLVHVCVEVHRCRDPHDNTGGSCSTVSDAARSAERSSGAQ